MPKPSLTVDVFVAALAVLGASTSAACSKATAVAPEPTPAAAAPAVQAEPAPGAPAADPNAAPAAPPAPPSPALSAAESPSGKDGPVGAKAVDGGPLAPNRKANASCGAGTCNADMKKGN